MKSRAIQYYGPQNIKYEEVIIKPPQAGEVVVKVEAALTCGTDVKTYRRGHPLLIKNIPSGFGHEFAGIVDRVGKDVKNFKPGDRVVAANSAPCSKCFYCERGEYNLCENLDLLNGAYAEYITVPARIVEKNMLILPDGLSFDKAAFCEPLANVVHGVERTGIKAGQSVGIIGIGPIGLMFARLAKLKGARVIAAGRNPLKLEMAREFAQADEIINLNKYPNPEMIFRDFSEEGRGLDVAVECVGLPEIWEQVFSLVRPGGTVHFFGGCKSGSAVTLDTTKMHYGDIKIMSVFHHTPEYFRKALDYIASGEVEVEKLITGVLGLKDIEYAMQRHIEGKAIKFLIKP
ncbi:MAG: alcohol dehydrogenase catalytic domain-containing protein [Heliobacteriaceae bacterium]|nr:alcohol dehydrogenase catalytic domain-containing protein [Heliobacteriaceae bacterium]